VQQDPLNFTISYTLGRITAVFYVDCIIGKNTYFYPSVTRS